MTPFRIIWAAVLHIFTDFGQTLRVFALPTLIAMAGSGGVYLLLLGKGGVGSLTVNFIYLTVVPSFCLIALLAFWATWSAVNYHRKVLLGERFGWFPRVHIREMIAYALMCIPFVIIIILAGSATHLMVSSLLSNVPFIWIVIASIAAIFLFAQFPSVCSGSCQRWLSAALCRIVIQRVSLAG